MECGVFGGAHTGSCPSLDEVAVDQLVTVLDGSAPNLQELELLDVDVGKLAIMLEASNASLPLTKLLLPHAPESVRQRIRARYPCATFAQFDEGDRYERTGE